MTIIIPKRYYDLYHSDPLYTDRERLRTLDQNIRKGKVTVVSDETYDRMEGRANP